MSKWYGSLSNRLEEGKNFLGRDIEIGDDITMYLWSDRHCYYITEIVSRKPLKIKVRPYYVCTDKEKAHGMGHQDWKYFKTLKAFHEYTGIPVQEVNGELYEEETWTVRYGKWKKEFKHTEMEYPDTYTQRERDSFKKNGYFYTYHELSGNISFGVRDYYYDWEF